MKTHRVKTIVDGWDKIRYYAEVKPNIWTQIKRPPDHDYIEKMLKIDKKAFISSFFGGQEFETGGAFQFGHHENHFNVYEPAKKERV